MKSKRDAQMPYTKWLMSMGLDHKTADSIAIMTMDRFNRFLHQAPPLVGHHTNLIPNRTELNAMFDDMIVILLEHKEQSDKPLIWFEDM